MYIKNLIINKEYVYKSRTIRNGRFCDHPIFCTSYNRFSQFHSNTFNCFSFRIVLSKKAILDFEKK